MSKKLTLRSALTATALLALLSAPIAQPLLSYERAITTVQAQEETVLNWVTSAEIPTLDSALAYDTVSDIGLSYIAEGLLRYSPEGKIVPAGAVDLPEVSEDGLTYTFELRQDAKWANGEAVTAHDYVYAWRRAVDPQTGSANAYTLDLLENAIEIGQGECPVEDLGVKALDDYHLEVTLRRPATNFLNIVSDTNFFPQNQAFIEAAGEDYGIQSEAVLGNGAFIIENWNSTALEWTLVKNPHYYGADDIQLDRVQVSVVKDPNTAVSLYEAGEIDIAPLSGNLLAQYQGSPDLVSFPGLSHSYIEFGISSSEPLQNEDLRKAFSLVIDRETLTQNVASGGASAVKGLVPQNAVFNPETGEDYTDKQKDYSTFDVDLAREHWQKAKEALGTDSVTLDLLITDSETTKTLAEYIQGQVQEHLPGFNINIRPLPAKTRFEEMMSFDFDIAIGGFSIATGDASDFLVNFVSDATHNHAQFKDPEFDALVEAINGELAGDYEARLAKIYEAENYLLDRQILVPFIQSNDNLLVSPEIENIDIIPNDTGVDFKTLTFK